MMNVVLDYQRDLSAGILVSADEYMRSLDDNYFLALEHDQLVFLFRILLIAEHAHYCGKSSGGFLRRVEKTFFYSRFCLYLALRKLKAEIRHAYKDTLTQRILNYVTGN